MSYRVKANPEMIKWARIDAGYDHTNLPKNIKDKYKDWETGKINPTWKQLRNLSNQYKRPSAFFFLTKPPKHETIDLIEYRRTDTLTDKKSPKLTFEIRNAKNKRDIYIELIEDLRFHEIHFKKYKFKSKNTFTFSKKIRNLLNVSLEDQKSWIYNKNNRKDLNHYTFLNKWKERINELGVLIFETSNVSKNEMRALSIYYDKYPIILLNGGDSVNGRIFSLIHELTHLMLGESAICDLNEKNSNEKFCNAIAGEFLAPSYDLKAKKEVMNHSKEWEDNEIFELSHKYGISNEAMLLRLLSLNKTTQQFYEYKKKEWNKKYKNNQHKSGGGSPVLNQVKYNGKMYSKLLLSAYENNVINPSDFSRCMGLKLKHFNELDNYLFG
jgi:Zn-dependent peptidase ImmA (M78 family)